MSDLTIDDDGFVDMDQFPDDGSDLAAEDLADLRAALHADPVDEPTPEAWDAMFHDVFTGADDGPFGLEDGLVADDLVTDVPDLDAGAEGVDADLDDGTDHEAEGGDGDVVDDLDDGGLGADDVPADDLDVDVDLDGILDVAPVDGGADHYDVDGADVDTPADISHDFEDTL